MKLVFIGFFLTRALSALVWGVLLSILLIAVFFFLVKGLASRSATPTPLSFIVLAVVWVLVCIQTVQVSGAFEAKSMTSDLHTVIDQSVSAFTGSVASNTPLTEAEAQQVYLTIAQEYPIVAHSLDGVSVTAQSGQNIASSIVSSINSELNIYIWKRVFWIVLFIIAGAFGLFKTFDQSVGRGYTSQRGSSLSGRKSYNDF